MAYLGSIRVHVWQECVQVPAKLLGAASLAKQHQLAAVTGLCSLTKQCVHVSLCEKIDKVQLGVAVKVQHASVIGR